MRCKETESHYHHHHPAKEQDEKGEVEEGQRRGEEMHADVERPKGWDSKKKKMQSKKTEEGVRIFGKGRTEKVREGSEGENRDGIIKYK